MRRVGCYPSRRRLGSTWNSPSGVPSHSPPSRAAAVAVIRSVSSSCRLRRGPSTSEPRPRPSSRGRWSPTPRRRPPPSGRSHPPPPDRRSHGCAAGRCGAPSHPGLLTHTPSLVTAMSPLDRRCRPGRTGHCWTAAGWWRPPGCWPAQPARPTPGAAHPHPARPDPNRLRAAGQWDDLHDPATGGIDTGELPPVGTRPAAHHPDLTGIGGDPLGGDRQRRRDPGGARIDPQQLPPGGGRRPDRPSPNRHLDHWRLPCLDVGHHDPASGHRVHPQHQPTGSDPDRSRGDRDGIDLGGGGGGLRDAGRAGRASRGHHRLAGEDRRRGRRAGRGPDGRLVGQAAAAATARQRAGRRGRCPQPRQQTTSVGAEPHPPRRILYSAPSRRETRVTWRAQPTS